jgi:hypothetical protein
MAHSPRIAVAVANNMLGSFLTLTTGTILIYSGTQPAGPDTAITTQVLIVTLAFTTFGAASGSVLTANSIGPGVAVSTNTATWFRMLSNASVPMIDGSVGTSGCDMNLNTVTISSGDTVAVSSCTITQPLT